MMKLLSCLMVVLSAIRFASCILLAAFCSGCGTFSAHMYGSPPRGAYYGVRADANLVSQGHPGFIIDFPFSFIADTLYLPADLWSQTPTPDPLKSWKPAGAIGCKVGYMSATIETLPGYKAISDDVQIFVNKLPVDTTRYDPNVNSDRRICYWIDRMTFFQDGTGQHAVKIEIPWKGTYWNYVLIYDKENKRIKKIKYSSGHYAC